jgi:hypothetical protein
MKFEVTSEQQKKINEWLEKIDQQIIEEQKKTMTVNEWNDLTCGGKYAYYGAIGGGIRYIFIPTSIGIITKVFHSYANKEIDVTDYNNW